MTAGLEDRVIAESPTPFGPFQERAANLSHLHILLASRRHKGSGTHEPGTSVVLRDILELRQQEFEVGAVVAVVASPASGKHAGCASEHIDDEPRVVGNSGQPGGASDVARFEEGVLFERDAVLHRGREPQLTRPDHGGGVETDNLGREDCPQLLHLVQIRGSEHEPGG